MVAHADRPQLRMEPLRPTVVHRDGSVTTPRSVVRKTRAATPTLEMNNMSLGESAVCDVQPESVKSEPVSAGNVFHGCQVYMNCQVSPVAFPFIPSPLCKPSPLPRVPLGSPGSPAVLERCMPARQCSPWKEEGGKQVSGGNIHARLYWERKEREERVRKEREEKEREELYWERQEREERVRKEREEQKAKEIREGKMHVVVDEEEVCFTGCEGDDESTFRYYGSQEEFEVVDKGLLERVVGSSSLELGSSAGSRSRSLGKHARSEGNTVSRSKLQKHAEGVTYSEFIDENVYQPEERALELVGTGLQPC